MSGGWIDVEQHIVDFSSVGQNEYFYWDHMEWVKVGVNLAVNKRCTLKWFNDDTQVYIVVVKE